VYCIVLIKWFRKR